MIGLVDTMLLKVSARSSPNAVAGAIAGVLREKGAVFVQVIGAGALNQAVKAIAIARSFVESDGIDPVTVPEFQDIDVGGESRTAIRLLVEDRKRAGGAQVVPEIRVERREAPAQPAPVEAEAQDSDD